MPTSTELFIKQNVFREYNGREIRVILLREDGLAQSMPSFLESIQNNITGLAPVYGPKCRMTHLAISSMTQVLIISLASHTKNTGKKGNKKNRETAVPMLETFLHDSTILKIALQMDKLASSLFFDCKVRIAKGKDLLSIGNPIHSRGSFGALYAALSGGNDGKIDKKSVMALFANEEFQFEPKMVALQAWTACYAISLHSRAKMLETPSINTTNFDALVLNVVAKNIRDMNRLISLKPNRVKHEVKLESLRAGELHAVSQRYKTKVGRLDGTQAIHITFRKGEKTANHILHSVSVQGRSAKLTVGGRLPVRDIQSVETIGRELPSSLEQSRTTIMLHALQGRLSLSNYPFVQTIWLPSKKVDWSGLSGNSLNPFIYFPSRHLNPSQEEAVNTILSNKDIDRVVLIHGPPGTGKTTVIAAAVTSAMTSSNKNTTLWLVSQSNVAVKNIAEKLAFVDFLDFKIVVSKDYHFEWHEHLYEKIVKNVITSDRLPEDMTSASRELGKSRVILCTLSMLSNPRLSNVIHLVPLQTVIIDEASQIEIGNYFPMLVTFRPTLRKLVFIGDDKQLAPYGSSDISELESIFEKGHIRKKAVMLDTQYRMPIPIGNFISQNVYKGLLKSQHALINISCCRFVNINNGVEEFEGHSWKNVREVQVATKIASQLALSRKSFRIITPYDPQRSLLEDGLKNAKLPWENKCFNVDAFQGNEDDYIIISVVRTKKLGFLNDLRRMNVMLTRCKKGMIICTNRNFIEGPASQSLIGKLCRHMGDSSWIGEIQVLHENVQPFV